MKYFLTTLCFVLFFFAFFSPIYTQHQDRITQVADMVGLIAFWDFSTMNSDSIWISHYDESVVSQPFLVYLRRIGNDTTYKIKEWPYSDNNSIIKIDTTGPFGHAVRFNRGYIFGEVPRAQFENTPLNIFGKQPFTMIAWVKFYGQRHMATGIWDEGGWNKYSGRRQVALFAGLFQQNGITAHISATGAASYPQSTISGSQYARERAIDGQAFKNNEWIMMTMTYDPDNNKVTAMLNAKMTPLNLTDPVVQDVYRYETERAANPYDFSHPIYSPRNFLLKYNGYNYNDDYVYEHRLRVALENHKLIYSFEGDTTKLADSKFRITCNVRRNDDSLLYDSFIFEALNGHPVDMPQEFLVENGDVFMTTLEEFKDNEWQQIGTDIERQVLEGAPFTFGRALGLGSENLTHGSQIYIDGVAVFNRVLSKDELQSITFINNASSVGSKDQESIQRQDAFFLSQNYPNPFNPITHIQYNLTQPQNVMLTIFNLQGQRVLELVNDFQTAGSHIISFDASTFSSGLYIYELKTDQFVEHRKMTVIH